MSTSNQECIHKLIIQQLTQKIKKKKILFIFLTTHDVKILTKKLAVKSKKRLEADLATVKSKKLHKEKKKHSDVCYRNRDSNKE